MRSIEARAIFSTLFSYTSANCGVNLVEISTFSRCTPATNAPRIFSDSPMPYTVAVSHRFRPAFIAASNTGFNVSTSVYYCINFTFDASRGLASGCSSG